MTLPTLLAAMTKRQRQVYLMTVEDALSLLYVSKALGVTYETVKNHQHAIFNVTGMSTRLELAVQYWKIRMEERDV